MGHLVQLHSEHLAQSLMNVPAYFIIVEVAIVLLGPRRWRRSNIVTINLSWPSTSWMEKDVIVSTTLYIPVFGHVTQPFTVFALVIEIVWE